MEAEVDKESTLLVTVLRPVLRAVEAALETEIRPVEAEVDRESALLATVLRLKAVEADRLLRPVDVVTESEDRPVLRA